MNWYNRCARGAGRGRSIRMLVPVGTAAAAIASSTLLWSCAFSGPPGGDLGVTPGGQQDIAAARTVIEDGGIPDPDWINVEGFLSEHSIPIEEPDGAGLLYATASAAWNADFDVFTPVATAVIGFGTTIDRETFQRDAMNLCLVIDASGSMNGRIDFRTGTTKLEAVKIAIDRLLAQLDENDLVSVVSFNTNTKLWVEAVPGNDIASIKAELDRIIADGNTDLAAGMRRAYRTVRAHQDDARSDRLLVFTDALLTVRVDTQADELIDVMNVYADRDIGASIFAIGTDFGQEVAYDISQVRGANYFFLGDYDRIVTVFDDEFDYLVTPVATDVSLVVDVPFTFDVADVYGIPVEEPLPHLLELSIPTLFLSTRQGGGAILVRIRPGALADLSTETTVADISLTYKTPAGDEESMASLTVVLPAGVDSEAAPYFETASTQRAVLLSNTALVLRSACDDVKREGYGGWYYNSHDPNDFARATERLTEFLVYFDLQTEGLEDQASDTSRSLSQERALVAMLLDNIASRN